MANTLNNLIPDFYRALDVVSRELSGFILSGTLDADTARAAVGQTVRVPITPASAAEDVVPGQLPPDTGDQVIGNTPITITKARTVPFRWVGEEQRGLNNGGAGYSNIRVDQISQAIRTLVNEVETDVAGMYVRTSRAYGVAGTTPFATNFNELPQLRKILSDNGATQGNYALVIDTTAGANLRSLPNLYKVNESGSDQLLRQGLLGEGLQGFGIRESAGVRHVTAGGGTLYVTSGASATGATVVTLATGSGTVLAGDVVKFQDDPNLYVVAVGTSAPGPITLAFPGLRQPLASGKTVTVQASYTANAAFTRSSLVMALRPPALPEEGDMAADRMLVTDDRSGITFEVAMYPQYRRIRYEVSLAWGYANIKPEHTALLLG